MDFKDYESKFITLQSKEQNPEIGIRAYPWNTELLGRLLIWSILSGALQSLEYKIHLARMFTTCFSTILCLSPASSAASGPTSVTLYISIEWINFCNYLICFVTWTHLIVSWIWFQVHNFGVNVTYSKVESFKLKMYKSKSVFTFQYLSSYCKVSYVLHDLIFQYSHLFILSVDF